MTSGRQDAQRDVHRIQRHRAHRRGAGRHEPVWESPALGRFEGREAIRSFFQGASGIFSFAIHYSLNGHIEVEGDSARAHWYLFMPARRPAGPVCR
jgi:hypothetical protein